MHKLSLSVAAAVMAASLFGVTPYDKMSLKGRTDKENPVSYRVGEPIVFTLFSDLENLPAEGLKVKWTCAGDDGQCSEGEVPFKLGEIATVTTSLRIPGFVKLEAESIRPVIRLCAR